jgi:hypothetical protein
MACSGAVYRIHCIPKLLGVVSTTLIAIAATSYQVAHGILRTLIWWA